MEEQERGKSGKGSGGRRQRDNPLNQKWRLNSVDTREELASQKTRKIQGYYEWLDRLDTTNTAIIKFQEFIKTSGKDWEDTSRKEKRKELEHREKLEEIRRTAGSEMYEIMQYVNKQEACAAARAWEEEYPKSLKGAGFQMEKCNPHTSVFMVSHETWRKGTNLLASLVRTPKTFT